MNSFCAIVFGLTAFLLGSIPFGLIIARTFQVKDLRVRGSGNIGATNVSRVLGFWPAGFLTFVMDLSKGAMPVLLLARTRIPALLPGCSGEEAGVADLCNPSLLWTVALLAVMGHCFSPWLQFRGGKGVATGFGALLVLTPVSAIIGAVAFALVFAKTKIGALSSLFGLALAMVTYVTITPIASQAMIVALLAFIVVLRHEENIDSMLEGRENKFR